MDRIKFVFINPSSHLWRVDPGQRPRGTRLSRFSMLSSLYAAASMPSCVEVRIVDEEVESIDFETDADLIGISFMTFNAPRAYEIADKFRTGKGKPVIFGGYHPTLMPEEAIQHADSVCVGDAEPNVPRMIEDFKAGQLKPFYRSGPVPLVNLPRPRRDLIRKRNYAPVDVIQATRGCSHRCSYCSVASFHQYSFRTRPIDEVIEELKTLGRHILFMDDSLTCDRDYAKELFAKMTPLNKRWFSQCGIEITQDEELLNLAAQSGCQGLFIGFESLSQECLRAWKKFSNLEKNYLTAVQRLHAAGIAVYAAFIFGGDDDTPDVFPTTLEFLLEAKVEILHATLMMPFPGTPLFEEMDQQGRIVDWDWGHYDFRHVVIEPTHMSRETLGEGFAWIKQQFYTRRRIIRRSWQCFHHLNLAAILRGVIPMNLGYRHKMTVDGTFKQGKDFNPQQIPVQ